MNGPVLQKVQIILTFKYPEIQKSWEFEIRSYDTSDMLEWPRE